MPIRVKHFTGHTANAGDTMIAIKSRDLIREVIPDADIITLAPPLTNEKIELFGAPDIIVIGGGPLFGSKHLSDWLPLSVNIPVYFLGIGTTFKHKEVHKFGIGTTFEQRKVQLYQSRTDKFTTRLRNIRLASSRECATKDRLEQIGVKCRVTGCPAMHLSREDQWVRKTISERDKDTLIFSYRDLYLPERLLLDESKALDIAKNLGFSRAIIVAHSYSKSMKPTDSILNPTVSHQRTLRIFKIIETITAAAISKSPLKRYIHPSIHDTLRFLRGGKFYQNGDDRSGLRIPSLGMKFHDVYAYPLLYRNTRLLIAYQLHATIMAAAVGTPYLHVFMEESSRMRDHIETFDPNLDLHLPANSASFEDVLSKGRSILENPDPLSDYNKRVNKAFAQWELFKEEMRSDLKTLKLIRSVDSG